MATKRKDPAAVSLGRKGGLKGGPARAAALTPEERSQAARKAVTARWAKAQRRMSVPELINAMAPKVLALELMDGLIQPTAKLLDDHQRRCSPQWRAALNTSTVAVAVLRRMGLLPGIE